MDELLKERLSDINEKIKQAAAKSGRSEKDVLLIAVTKTIDAQTIQKAIDLGITDIGENKAQELLEKYDVLGSGINYHFIGRLQTNKVKYIVDKVKLIHSVDRIKLAAEINAQARKINKVSDILIEINIGNEQTKGGIEYSEALETIKQTAGFENIRVRGLMAIPPISENKDKTRAYFKKMFDLFVDIRGKKIDNISMDYLSMGMSGDFDIAIEEGANIIRLGTKIFGPRIY